MPPDKLYFDDVEIGMKWSETGTPFTKERIISFAREFDPVPMHIDEAAAKESYYGGLIASGAHVFSVWRLLNFTIHTRSGLNIIAGAGADKFRLHRPVRPGDVLTLYTEIEEKVPSEKKPDRGLIHSKEVMHNQNDEMVMSMRSSAFVFRKSE